MANGTAIEEVSAEVAGQKIRITGQRLNDLFTILTFVLICLIGYVLYTHQQDAKDAAKEFVGAIKEQTIAVREQTVAARENNCLQRFEQKDRPQQYEFCKQLSR